MDVLRQSANSKGYVKSMDVEGIARITGITEHDVAKHLWGLQKQGLVGFSTKRGRGGHTVPYRFRLKGGGMTAIETRPPGPLERLMAQATEPDQRDTAPEPTGRLSEAAEPVAGIQAPETTETPEEAVPSHVVAQAMVLPQDVIDDAYDVGDLRRPAFDADNYPQIHALIERVAKRGQVEEAARALEQAGLDDLAVQALDAIPDLTPLEVEILAVIRAFRRPDWNKPGPTLRDWLKEHFDAR